ncbi:hypothetical protein [Rhodobium gokarnense]|uniref:Na+-dependent transporter n=1 Tax=Rhodobium gokarnense TaxID=364296 RepID=A0ABT3HAW7_9HYPH|nr:hypothetical protein [Rhodobium gokarnense]MCW2307530.1 putative Na+-dependent transporter [Rhodobium gokarnense]
MIARLLRLLAANGRMVLVAGLVCGVGLPDLAAAMKPYLPEIVAALLFIAAFRIGPREAAGKLRDLGSGAGIVGLYQLLLPLGLALGFLFLGVSAPLAAGLVLMAAAPSISGSPNLTLLAGSDPAPALRLLLMGTAAVPLTVVPVFWVTPALGDAGVVAAAALRLLVLILGAGAAAFALRRLILKNPTPEALQVVDGVSALALAIAVVGLMAAVGPALREEPLRLAATLAFAFAANFGLQIAAFVILGALGVKRERVAFSIVAGNRNIALFLTALPAAITDPLLLFIGCYQIPMYLTPLILGRLYAGANADGPRA